MALLTLPPQTSRSDRTLVGGLMFVVVLLLTLITLPPVTSGRAEALRARLANDVSGFAEALTATENDMQEMQAATRGYMLTREPVFLEQYRAAQAALPTRLADLEQLGPLVDADIEPQVTELIAVIERWQREGGDRQIAFVERGQTDAAIREIAAGNSQTLFDSFRKRTNDLQAQTQRVHADLQEQINRTRSRQVALTTGLGVSGLIGIGFVLVGFGRMLRLVRALGAERERSQQLAREAQTERQRLQAVFDHSPEGIVFAEAPNGQINLINPAAEALLGELLPSTRIEQQPWTKRLFRPGGERLPLADMPLLRSLQRDEPSRSMELVIEQPDGQRIPVILTTAPLHAEDGTLGGAVAVFQDLRALRQVERMKSDFVALVSHELRTPLTAIHGYVQMLQADNGLPTARTRDIIRIIAEQTERLQELIDNLLSLAQVEAGALRLRRALVQPQPLIQRAVAQMRDRFEGVRLQNDIANPLPDISADERRIEQVLFNLLDNARKFSPPNGVVTVHATVQENMLRIGVRDQGPGIAPTERERVFERFYQIEQPTTRNVGGSGLGLAICKAIVEAHGGQIWIEGASGGGAQFCFTLPATPQAKQHGASLPLTRRVDDGQPRVLIVDDDPALRRMLETSLPTHGYSVQSVAESQAALVAVVEQPPDVILLDVMLPGVDGFDLCRQMREWTSVPILMLTARAAEQDVITGLQLGADDYVTKPFRINELNARIEAVLRRAQPETTRDGPSLIQIGELVIDLAQRRVAIAQREIELTPIEYQILTFLARHAGQLLTHRQILEAVWGEEYGDENHYLWVHIAHLRQKLEPESKRSHYIVTERGVGYRMVKQ